MHIQLNLYNTYQYHHKLCWEFHKDICLPETQRAQKGKGLYIYYVLYKNNKMKYFNINYTHLSFLDHHGVKQLPQHPCLFSAFLSDRPSVRLKGI